MTNERFMKSLRYLMETVSGQEFLKKCVENPANGMDASHIELIKKEMGIK